MLSSTYYQRNTSYYQQDVAHLFEHLVIDGFYERLAPHGRNPALIGWIGGETFDDALFIDGYFYDPDVNESFANYLAELPRFSQTAIERSLRVIQAEEKSIITVRDRTALHDALVRMSSGDKPIAKASGTPAANLLILRKNASAFRDVTITVYGEDLSADEQKVFLRLYVMLIDIMHRELQVSYGHYSRGSSVPRFDGKHMGFLYTLSIERKGISLKQIENTAYDAFTSFRLYEHYPEIRKHLAVYAKEPLWKGMPAEYFRNTGIITTNEEVARLATKRNIGSILSKLQVYVRVSLKSDEQIIS